MTFRIRAQLANGGLATTAAVVIHSVNKDKAVTSQPTFLSEAYTDSVESHTENAGNYFHGRKHSQLWLLMCWPGLLKGLSDLKKKKKKSLRLEKGGLG